MKENLGLSEESASDVERGQATLSGIYVMLSEQESVGDVQVRWGRRKGASDAASECGRETLSEENARQRDG